MGSYQKAPARDGAGLNRTCAACPLPCKQAAFARLVACPKRTTVPIGTVREQAEHARGLV